MINKGQKRNRLRDTAILAMQDYLEPDTTDPAEAGKLRTMHPSE